MPALPRPLGDDGFSRWKIEIRGVLSEFSAASPAFLGVF